MFRYLVRRLLQMILVFLGTTFIVFALMFAGGEGDPIQNLAGEKPVSAAQRAQLTEKFHLDDGFFERYWYYLKDLVTGNLGESLTGRDISTMILDAFPATAKLATIAILVTIVFGVTAGVIAGIRRGSIFDNSTLVLTLVIIGIPTVVLAPLGQLLFGVKFPIFPATANNPPTWYELILPGIVLGLLSVATAMRLTRASVAENLRADFVRTAKSKGMPGRRVIGVHVLRNSLIPIVTFIGVELGSLMGGAIITERVFNISGIGNLLYKNLNLGDAPVVIGTVSVLVIVFLIANLIVDLLYAVLDPRIRYE
ncbi:ABC transporter permease [Catellatospora bangladeshensis]|uniref:ABC transporter permease n=1 Tax=Catellatospora bangladeshensis TaxID=310355 RepID=A0A8J3JHT2_9ACTN|nr:ABC transporter permease [Catellatospora bangladeshensis]GIF79245.1 ABC transporter permease [Catellatospora bangladeshensis]